MTETETVKASTRGGFRPGAGRKKGSKNRVIQEREAAIGSQIDRIRAGARTGEETLGKLMKLAEGCMALHRPTPKREILTGGQKNPDEDWDRFGQWFDRCAYVSKELAKYQSPTFKAIAVMAPAPTEEPRPFADGNVTRIPDAEDAERVYLRMIGAAA
jgi:hypothetical protein